jgi:hypothetical protein
VVYGSTHEDLGWTFFLVEEDPLLVDPPAQHFVLGFEPLDLANQLVPGASREQKEEWLEDASHRDKIPAKSAVFSGCSKLLIHRWAAIRSRSRGS